MTDGYNYEHFDVFVASGEERTMFEAFTTLVKAGSRAPDGEMLVLGEGRDTRLSDLWADQAVVLEFGSFT